MLLCDHGVHGDLMHPEMLRPSHHMHTGTSHDQVMGRGAKACHGKSPRTVPLCRPAAQPTCWRGVADQRWMHARLKHLAVPSFTTRLRTTM